MIRDPSAESLDRSSFFSSLQRSSKPRDHIPFREAAAAREEVRAHRRKRIFCCHAIILAEGVRQLLSPLLASYWNFINAVIASTTRQTR